MEYETHAPAKQLKKSETYSLENTIGNKMKIKTKP